MPLIGIIRGFGEGYAATGYIIKLIKAINRRFRSKIRFEEVPLGDCVEYGSSLTNEAISLMQGYDCIYIGDIYSPSNPVDYTYKNIAYALSNNIEYTCISGFNNHCEIDVSIASYFDGGTNLRESTTNADGSVETRICSSYSITNIVKNVSRACENSRRRLAFVKDGDNEYCADAFYKSFERFVLPLSNFRLLKFTLRDICREMLFDPGQFDFIFASPSFSEMAIGIYEFVMKDGFAFYNKYKNEKAVYALRSLQTNSACGDYTPSLCSYIIAFCDMLKNEFHMEKEAGHVRKAIDYAIASGVCCETGEAFISAVIEELNRPVTTKYSKSAPKSRYIR